ncbi:hypothetical protein CANARDRAFT_28410 [[Candida] arabinofermentans NRRL YB-2248]|uniref:L-type lectin-like domain-containing protein n=1 Tax=[Candida] arabinofermentans NRRL YB-2248 TaxID=983967 RepID=A0A1E4T046_9ASCO|nr:hypothetical protein CANARDRAFT_28410 [[Candida] arabinofermentans NRRL YB-2248]
MMKSLISLLCLLLTFGLSVLSHSPPPLSVQNVHSLIPGLSFPDLVKIQSIDEVKKSWMISNDVQFSEGRLILTPTPSISSNANPETLYGSVWSLNKNEKFDKFTAELTMRSTGAFGVTNSGFSLFFIENDGSKNDKHENFGGPLIYKGLQISLDANDLKLGPVLRVYLNDGTKEIQISEDYLGAYTYEYQDSQVPMTLKVAVENNWLKITCDNKLLFESDKINLSPIMKNMKIGLTASAPKDVVTTEQFEILVFKLYNEILHDLKVDPTETLFAKHANMKVNKNEPGLNANKFRNMQSQLRSSLDIKKNNLNTDSSFDALSSKIDQLEALASGPSDSSKQMQVIQKQLFDTTKSIKVLTEKLYSHQLSFLSSYEELSKQNSQLNQKFESILGLVERQNQLLNGYDNRFSALSKYFDTHSENFKNIDNKLKTMEDHYKFNAKGEDSSFKNDMEVNLSKLASGVKLILIPVVLLLVVVTLLVYRLRNDIKHSKVL